MRKVMCLLLTLCFVFAVPFTAGCSKNEKTSSDTASQIPAPVVYDAPELLTLVNPNFFAGDDAANGYSFRWAQKMDDIGIGITVFAPVVGASEDYIDYLIDGIGKSVLSGLVYVENYAQFERLLASGKIAPVGEYLAENETWNSIPDAFKDAFRYGKEYYAIPASGNYTLPWTTYVSDKYAEELEGIISAQKKSATAGTSESVGTSQSDATSDIPDSPEAVLKAILKEKASDPKFGGLYTVELSSLSWLFDGFGAPLGRYGENIYYNPDAQSVVDAMLFDGAEEALSALRTLYGASAVNTDFLTNSFSGLQKAAQDKTAGILSFAGPGLDGYTGLTGLSGDSYVTTEGGGYCLAVGAAQPGECANLLVDLLWENKDSFLMMSAGIEGYTIGESMEIISEYISQENRTPVPYPNLAGPMAGLFDLDSFVKVYTDTPKTDRDVALNNAKILCGLYKDQERNIKVIDYRYLTIYSDIYEQKEQEIGAALRKLLTDAATNSASTVKDALEEYRNTMAALGGDDMFAEANSALGLLSAQSYAAENVPKAQP